MNNELAQNYKNIVKKIVKRHSQNRVLNRYEYYVMGGVPIKRAYPVVYELYRQKQLTRYELEILRDYFQRQMVLGVSYNKNFILKTYYQFGNTVISDSEKVIIWDRLRNLGLADKDIDDVTFSGAVRVYAIEKGLLKIDSNGKKRVLKKK